MWNDTDTPIAVFFTFRCYGTWLHGDDRGSVDRHKNVYGTPEIKANPGWRKYNENQLLREPVTLNAARRRSVERAIRETCLKRNWHILAINVRTNHVHVVIRIGTCKAKDALIAIKANATRVLRQEGLWTIDATPWAEKGSKRYLWNEKSVEDACNYVMNMQGDALP